MMENKIKEKKETEPITPSHYQHDYDTIKAQVTPGYNYFKELVSKGMDEEEAYERSIWVTYAIKHLVRLGLKDDSIIELKKAQNYLHRAETGKWLEK